MKKEKTSIDESIIDTYLNYPELKEYCIEHIYPFMDKHFSINDLYNKLFTNETVRTELYYSAKLWIRKNIVESKEDIFKEFVKLNLEVSHPIKLDHIPELLLISYVIYHKIIKKDIPDILIYSNPKSLVCLPPEVAKYLYGLIKFNKLCLSEQSNICSIAN